ncbi:hypothetical protein I302_103408 [Kwoniella bestiolae CBS 10118]|uniref:Ysc84 actin-binding domain-containing protein n=1 Tax=Kwoniella bestiolae CBS 10118 TaxID=1296100 RepID=A0A1B9G8B5_9TREE|nr:hypothetical protein I302_02108 [Kwoniella bestiolae CBS 10118]OCF27268.1 hypothetical protein I302_02108 [Kwoniella bestiolae CBS 10118]
MSFDPPPKRTPAASASSTRPTTPSDPAKTTWKDKMKTRGAAWGKVAVEKGVKISDNIGGRVNDIAEKRFGTEAFWPVTGDFPREMDKCARILRAFTVDGIVTEEKEKPDPSSPDDSKKKKKIKVIRKIPPSVIASAKGLAIFTSMRTGIAPFGGAGGAGVVVARLPDGSWSAPASISPNNLSAGFLLGVDVYDCVLVIRTQEALDSFKTHKVTIGAELAVAAGPYGAGAAVEAGKERAPLFSYVKSRGVYAGVEVVGQVFVERFDENGAMYHWPGVKAGDILSGKVKVPLEAASLQSALKDAETGRAQALKGDSLDIVVQESTDLELNEGETLKLPLTPDQTDGHEHESDPETERLHHAVQTGSHNPSRTNSPPLPPLVAPVPVHAHQNEGATRGKGGRLVPPPLPGRNPNRPNLEHLQHSSRSRYSDALDGQDVVDSPTSIRYDAPSGPPPDHLLPPAHIDSHQPGQAQHHSPLAVPPPPSASSTLVPEHSDGPPRQGTEELPPAYSDDIGGGATTASTYPREKKAPLDSGLIPADAMGADGQPMSESERREWEEFLSSGDNPTAAAGPSGGRDVQGLTESMDDTHLYEDARHVHGTQERYDSLKNPYDEDGKGKGKEEREDSLKNPF